MWPWLAHAAERALDGMEIFWPRRPAWRVAAEHVVIHLPGMTVCSAAEVTRLLAFDANSLEPGRRPVTSQDHLRCAGQPAREHSAAGSIRPPPCSRTRPLPWPETSGLRPSSIGARDIVFDVMRDAGHAPGLSEIPCRRTTCCRRSRLRCAGPAAPSCSHRTQGRRCCSPSRTRPCSRSASVSVIDPGRSVPAGLDE